ncbi:2560_t:CDS:2, partial [Racocetra persica]
YVLRSYSHFLMWKTCQQFVSHVRSRQGLEDGQDRYPVFDVRPTSTLGYTIAKISATKAHRLWVVDERMRAIGVSLTDILLVIARSGLVPYHSHQQAKANKAAAVEMQKGL